MLWLYNSTKENRCFYRFSLLCFLLSPNTYLSIYEIRFSFIRLKPSLYDNNNYFLILKNIFPIKFPTSDIIPYPTI